MEMFVIFVGYVLGALIGYEIVKFLRVMWIFHKFGKAYREVEKLFEETINHKED
ncbi:hypothetical protein [Enterococcus faecium]|uniref:hypothetical protein n=1 Tax=Enterococcus faecium TaxID=1352 RepID=UPI0015E3414B|nr:hypothetical protein [Enterococcus faecium]